jgi:hypothetical protein
MEKSYNLFVGTFIKTSVIVFASLAVALYVLYAAGMLDFDTQLYPMLNLAGIIAALSGLIHTVHRLPLFYDLPSPENRMLIPARFLPSNHSRKAPPAVDV